MNKSQYLRIVQWQDKIFTTATPLSCVNHLIEEVHELKQSIESGEIDKGEIADCFMLLMGVCNRAGLSYLDIILALDAKMVVNENRKWGEVNEQGYVKHIE